MMSYARDLRIKKNGKGYALNGIEKEAISITPAEALGLLESLMHIMPEVTDGIRKSWELREVPRIKVERFYEVSGTGVEVKGYQSVITHQCGATTFRSWIEPTEGQAIEAAEKAYGATLPTSGPKDHPGSKEQAEQKALFATVKQLAKDEGMGVEKWLRQNAGQEIEL